MGEDWIQYGFLRSHFSFCDFVLKSKDSEQIQHHEILHLGLEFPLIVL